MHVMYVYKTLYSAYVYSMIDMYALAVAYRVCVLTSAHHALTYTHSYHSVCTYVMPCNVTKETRLISKNRPRMQCLTIT